MNKVYEIKKVEDRKSSKTGNSYRVAFFSEFGDTAILVPKFAKVGQYAVLHYNIDCLAVLGDDIKK